MEDAPPSAQKDHVEDADMSNDAEAQDEEEEEGQEEEEAEPQRVKIVCFRLKVLYV